MKERFRDFPLTVEDVKRIMKKEEAKRATWFAIGISVVLILAGLVIWIAKRREKDLEEHYEYFDDDFDELDDDYEEFDESIYDDTSDDEEDQVEYVKIKDFINEEETPKEEEALKEEEATKEEKIAENEKTDSDKADKETE